MGLNSLILPPYLIGLKRKPSLVAEIESIYAGSSEYLTINRFAYKWDKTLISNTDFITLWMTCGMVEVLDSSIQE